MNEPGKQQKIIVVGQGGREHAILQALAEDPSGPELFAWPGSDAMGGIATRVNLSDMRELAPWMRDNSIDLCVVGEEKYLAAGLVDECLELGISAWGPKKFAAQLESSKAFAKDLWRATGYRRGAARWSNQRRNCARPSTRCRPC